MRVLTAKFLPTSSFFVYLCVNVKADLPGSGISRTEIVNMWKHLGRPSFLCIAKYRIYIEERLSLEGMNIYGKPDSLNPA